MILIVAALILAVIGVVWLARSFEPKQRAVLVAVFVLAVVYLLNKSVELGLLGRRTK